MQPVCYTHPILVHQLCLLTSPISQCTRQLPLGARQLFLAIKILAHGATKLIVM